MISRTRRIRVCGTVAALALLFGGMHGGVDYRAWAESVDAPSDASDPAPSTLDVAGGVRIGVTRIEGQLWNAWGPFAEARVRATREWSVALQFARTSASGSFTTEPFVFLGTPDSETRLHDRIEMTDVIVAAAYQPVREGIWDVAILIGGGPRFYDAERNEVTTNRDGDVVYESNRETSGISGVGSLQVHVGVAPADWIDLGGGLYMDAAMLNGFRDQDRLAFSLGLRFGATLRF